VPDLPLCLGVLKHRAPLARGPIFLPKLFYDGFLLMCGAILNLKAFCFGAIPDIINRVLSLWDVCLCRPTGSFRAQIRGLIT